MATDNSKPVKRIMSTISKHSEEAEAEAEDDEICSGNLWKNNDAIHSLEVYSEHSFCSFYNLLWNCARGSFIWCECSGKESKRENLRNVDTLEVIMIPGKWFKWAHFCIVVSRQPHSNNLFIVWCRPAITHYYYIHNVGECFFTATTFSPGIKVLHS